MCCLFVPHRLWFCSHAIFMRIYGFLHFSVNDSLSFTFHFTLLQMNGGFVVLVWSALVFCCQAAACYIDKRPLIMFVELSQGSNAHQPCQSREKRIHRDVCTPLFPIFNLNFSLILTLGSKTYKRCWICLAQLMQSF